MLRSPATQVPFDTHAIACCSLRELGPCYVNETWVHHRIVGAMKELMVAAQVELATLHELAADGRFHTLGRRYPLNTQSESTEHGMEYIHVSEQSMRLCLSYQIHLQLCSTGGGVVSRRADRDSLTFARGSDARPLQRPEQALTSASRGELHWVVSSRRPR